MRHAIRLFGVLVLFVIRGSSGVAQSYAPEVNHLPNVQA